MEVEIKVTPEQEAKLPAYRDKFLKQALSTEPADFNEFKQGIDELYSIHDLRPVPLIPVQSLYVGQYVSSMLCALIAAVEVLEENKIHPTSPDCPTAPEVESIIEGYVKKVADIKKIDPTYIGKISERVIFGVNAVGLDLSLLSDAIGHISIESHVVDHSWFGGQFWIAWHAYRDFFEKECAWIPSADAMRRMDAFAKCERSVCVWWANVNFVVACDRPVAIRKNVAGQLHCETGMALEFRDGWGEYVVDGIRVPGWVVTTPAEKITNDQALLETNADVQRIIIKKIGADRLLVGSPTIEEWTCPKTGLKYTMKQLKCNNIDRRYLVYEHASMPGLFYAKAVPPEAKNIVWMRAFQTGVFGGIDVARDNMRKCTMTDEELIAQLPDEVQ